MSVSTRRTFVANKPNLFVEPLESRLNLSSLIALPVPPLNGTHSHPRWIASLAAISEAPRPLASVLGGDAAAITSGDNGWIAPASYTSISHARLQSRPSGIAIGFWRSGGYAEFTVTVAETGTYTLQVGVASMNPASFTASINGTLAATFNTTNTGSPATFTNLSQTVTLQAGTQLIRFTSTERVPFHFSGFALLFQSPPPLSSSLVTVSSSSGDDAIMPAVVSVTQRTMTSFTELDITGIISNSSIFVTQSGNTLTITGNNQTQQITGTFGTLVIYASMGNSSVTVDSSVTIPTTVYAGTGNDTLTDATQAQASIVTLDGAADTVSGNGINTAFWVDPADIVNATLAEQTNGGVHLISTIYQPYTAIPGAAGFVTGVRDGSNLIDPTAVSTTTTRLTSNSFWGTGPVQQDINQGEASDCYFLTSLQSLARLQPARVQQMGVDLADGTYLIEFQRGGIPQYVRVDGDLPTGGSFANGLAYAHPGASGDQWAPLFEKAYAYFRKAANTYSSLDNGFMTSVYGDLGVAASTYILPADQNAFYATATSKLSANLAVDVLTNSTITLDTPLVPSHTYSVLSLSQDLSGTVWVTMRNPWGIDGFNDDSNPNDGIITISYATLQANSLYASLMT